MATAVVASPNHDPGREDLESQRIGEYSVTQILGRARAIVKERTKDWEICNLKAEERIPRFHRDGRYLWIQRTTIDLSSLFFRRCC